MSPLLSGMLERLAELTSRDNQRGHRELHDVPSLPWATKCHPLVASAAPTDKAPDRD
jgi:hypothetical protein